MPIRTTTYTYTTVAKDVQKWELFARNTLLLRMQISVAITENKMKRSQNKIQQTKTQQTKLSSDPAISLLCLSQEELKLATVWDYLQRPSYTISPSACYW